MKTILFLLLYLMVFVGCGRKELKYPLADDRDCINISDSDLYIRKVYADGNEEDGQKLIVNDTLPSNEKTFLSDIQYLLIKKDVAIYITTKPSRYIYDKTDSYLINNRLPNVIFFNTIYIGKVVQNSAFEKRIVFKSKHFDQEWLLKSFEAGKLELTLLDEVRHNSAGKIHSITTMKPTNAFKHAVIFEKQDKNIYFSFKVSFGEDKNSKGNTELKADSICMIYQNVQHKKIIDAHVKFNNGMRYRVGENCVPFFSEFNPYFMKRNSK